MQFITEGDTVRLVDGDKTILTIGPEGTQVPTPDGKTVTMTGLVAIIKALTDANLPARMAAAEKRLAALEAKVGPL